MSRATRPENETAASADEDLALASQSRRADGPTFASCRVMIRRLVILATAMVGCVPSTDNLQLGSGDVLMRGVRPGGYERTEHWPVASAWAAPYYSYPITPTTNYFDEDEGFGGISISFSGETTSPAPPTCRDRQLLTTTPTSLSLDTKRHGRPKLAAGDVPFVFGVDLEAPVIASLDPYAIDAGHVTITSVDDEHITGTFEGTGLDGDESQTVDGYFDVPICWN
jgi:hypothetical protein